MKKWRPPRLCSKKTKGRTELPEGFACPIASSIGSIIAGRGRVISGRLVNSFGRRFGTSALDLLVLYLRPNDYLNTVFDDVVSLFGSYSNNALAILPLRVRSLFSRERNMLNQIETYPLGLLEGLLMQYSTEIKLKSKYLNTKIGLIAFYTRRTTMSFGISR